MSLGLKKDLIVIDLETTGLDPYDGEITEVGFVQLDGSTGKTVGSFNTLLKIEGEVPEVVTDLTGIDKEKTERHGMNKDDVANFLVKALDDKIIVAHNLVFELEWMKIHFDIEPKMFYDTLTIARYQEEASQSKKLGKLCEKYDIDLVNAHTALEDAIACSELFLQYTSSQEGLIKLYHNTIDGSKGVRYKPKYTREILGVEEEGS